LLGRLPDDLRRKAEAVAQVDATFIAATRPGQMLGYEGLADTASHS